MSFIIAYLAYPVAAMAVPLVCFTIGVKIAIAINRYPDTPKVHLWWMSVPVAFLIVGANLSNSTITTGDTTTFAFMETPGQLLTAMGVTVLYGVLTPSLFETFLARLQNNNQNPGDPPQQDDEAGGGGPPPRESP